MSDSTRLDSVGSTPDGHDEYVCPQCGAEFVFALYDEKLEITYEKPKFCPMCGLEANYD